MILLTKQQPRAGAGRMPPRTAGIAKFVLHSEVGEVNMQFGLKAQQFVAILARLPRTCAADLHQHLELCRYRGDFNEELNLSMALFKPGTSKALPYLEQCSCVEVVEHGGLILREVYGYGPGIKVDKSTLESLDHYGIMQVEETGSSAAKTTEGQMIPQRRENNGAMGQIAAEMRESAVATKAEMRAQKEAETREALAAVEPAPIARTCEACSARSVSEERHLFATLYERRMRKETNSYQRSEGFAYRKQTCVRASERAARSETIGRATCSISW